MTLWTFVCEMSVLTTLETRDLVQSLVAVRAAVPHGVHPVVGLGVRHEGLPGLRHLLLLQLGRHLVAVRHLARRHSNIERSNI